MERFRLRARQEPKRGMLWELHLFPERPSHKFREADARIMGSTASPESIQWLRSIADAYLRRAEEPESIAGNEFGPNSEPRWLRHEDGMRLALAFSSVRYLTKASQRRRFREGLESLPSEVLLYWFVLCFYGYRQAAGKAALRTLLTHEEPVVDEENFIEPYPRLWNRQDSTGDLFSGLEKQEGEKYAKEDQCPSGKVEGSQVSEKQQDDLLLFTPEKGKPAKKSSPRKSTPKKSTTNMTSSKKQITQSSDTVRRGRHTKTQEGE